MFVPSFALIWRLKLFLIGFDSCFETENDGPRGVRKVISCATGLYVLTQLQGVYELVSTL